MHRPSSTKVSDRMLFKNNAWVEKMKKAQMKPGLLGVKKGWYYALVIVAEDQIDSETQRLFFESLQDFVYDEEKEEVVFKRSSIVLNISALYQPEAIELDDLTGLFDTSHGLRTSKGLQTCVRYFGEKKVVKFNSKKIISPCHGPSQTIDDIKQSFALDLELKKGHVVTQAFSVPGILEMVRIGNSLQPRGGHDGTS